MKNKAIIFASVIIIIVIITIIIVNINSRNSSKTKQYEDFDKTTMLGSKKIEDEISNALNKCKKLCTTKDDFFTYFRIENINNFMEKGDSISLVENIKNEDFSVVDVYSSNNELLQDFPRDKVQNVLVDALVIEPNTDELIKVYSKVDTVTYYYILNISETGYYSLKEICYIVGENEKSEIVNSVDVNGYGNF